MFSRLKSLQKQIQYMSPICYINMNYQCESVTQVLHKKFNEQKGLWVLKTLARVAELVDARDLKSLESNLVPVRLRPWAYEINIRILLIIAAIILL